MNPYMAGSHNNSNLIWFSRFVAREKEGETNARRTSNRGTNLIKHFGAKSSMTSFSSTQI